MDSPRRTHVVLYAQSKISSFSAACYSSGTGVGTEGLDLCLGTPLNIPHWHGTGVAAGFNAPIAGVFFAVESVLQREPVNSETEAKNSSGLTVAMILLASVLAALVSRAGLGDTPAFKVPQYEIQSVWELPLILVLGAICGVTSVGFSYLSEVSYKATAFLHSCACVASSCPHGGRLYLNPTPVSHQPRSLRGCSREISCLCTPQIPECYMM